VLSWAATSGYRVGENPARWHEHLEELLPKPDRFKRIQHHPAMSYREIGAFLRALASGSGSSAGARALAFTILTACRSGETLQAQWSEIGFDQRLWTIPGERMKNRRAHRVPLSGATLEILQAQAGRDPVWVFPGSRAGKPLSGSVMRNVLRKMGRTDVTVHGFRSTFRVWAAERGTPKEIAELSLAHATGSVIEIAYQRSDLIEQRRALMQDWADWCAVPVDSHSGVDRTTN
jgi:integrase